MSDFTKDTIKVFSGSAVASGITLLLLPIITRLFSVEDFGSLQLFLSITATFVVVTSLKYEMAIVLPKERHESDQVVVLCCIALVSTACILAGVLYIADRLVLQFFNAEPLKPYLFFVVAAVFFSGLAQIGQFLLVSRKEFGFLARNKIFQAAMTQGSAVGAGSLHLGFPGLFFSQIIGTLTASFLVFRSVPVDFFRVRIPDLKRVAGKYRKFPLVNAPGVLMNTLALELPVFMLAKYFGAEIVGYYMIASRLINQPMSLVTGSITQVYFQAGAQAFHRRQEHLFRLYKGTVRKLALLGLPAAVLVVLVAPPVIRFVCGPQWAEAGVYIQLIVFWKFFEFLNAPVSTSLSIINRQEVILVLRGFSLPFRFFFMYLFRDDPRQMLGALSLAAGCYYAAMNFIIFLNLRALSREEAGSIS